MLFAELEGTSALLTRVGASVYAAILREQRRIVHDAATAFGGHEMDTEGEGAFVVFASATAALAAAAQMQRETADQPWPASAGDESPVRVRAGVDTGEPDRHEDGYIGLAVHHTARVSAAAHGGQVLVGPSAWALARGELPAGVRAVDVGEHRLKDIPDPVHLHRLVVDGTPEVTAPPRGLGTPARLPQPNTPLVARSAELGLLSGYLAPVGDGWVRLVTLVGPGGVGKTRLAVEAAAAVAADFAGGVHFADLSAVGTATAAWSRLAEVLSLGDDGDDGPRAAATRFVAGRHCLLVLDNLEQVEGGDVLVAELVAASEHSVVLATSRQPVRLQAERVVPVEPLDESAAVELFLQHARRVRPGLNARTGRPGRGGAGVPGPRRSAARAGDRRGTAAAALPRAAARRARWRPVPRVAGVRPARAAAVAARHHRVVVRAARPAGPTAAARGVGRSGRRRPDHRRGAARRRRRGGPVRPARGARRRQPAADGRRLRRRTAGAPAATGRAVRGRGAGRGR